MKILLLFLLCSCSTITNQYHSEMWEEEHYSRPAEDNLQWVIKTSRENKPKRESYPEKPIECNYTCLGR